MRDGSCLRRAAGRGSFARFETHVEPNPIRCVGQASKTSCYIASKTYVPLQEAAACHEGRIVPSAGASYKSEVLSPRELPANEGEQAANQTLYESSAKLHRPAASLQNVRSATLTDRAVRWCQLQIRRAVSS